MSDREALARLERKGARAVPRAWWPMAGGAALVFAAATYSRADADLWGHLRYGLDALEAGRLTSVDPYSFTQDRPWINHEWMSEVQTAVAWWLGGVAGLVLLKAALVFGAFWLMWDALRGAALGVRLALMLFAAVGTVHITSAVRPQAWTFLAFGLLCHALAFRRLDHRRWLPVLFALWANVHGGWVVGLGVLGVWAAAESLHDRDARRQWLWLAPISALATVATPYGWRLWEFLLTTVRPERSIEEWQPIFTKDAGFWGPWVVAVMLGVWAVRSLRVRRLPVMAVLLMLAWSSFRVMRIGSLFVEASVIFLAPAVIARWPACLPVLPVSRSRAEPLVAGYLFAAAGAAAIWIGLHTLTCLPFGGPWAPEMAPVRLLSAAPAGRVVTFFDWGQYALWHLGPRLAVSMDGRRETVYTDARLREHDAIVLGEPEGLETLARWRAEYVWLPARSTATRDWLVANGYRLVYSSDESFVAVRDDLPPLGTSAVPARPCFPG